MEGLADRLVDDLGRQPEKRPSPRCDRRPEVSDVVDLWACREIPRERSTWTS